MYNVRTLTRFLTFHHYVFRPISRQQIFTFNARVRTELSAKIHSPTVKAQFRLTVWRRGWAEVFSNGSILFWHCSSLSGNFVLHLRWFFENRLLAAQIAQIPHCAPFGIRAGSAKRLWSDKTMTLYIALYTSQSIEFCWWFFQVWKEIIGEKNCYEFERTGFNAVHIVKVKIDTVQDVATNSSDYVLVCWQ